MNRDNKIPMLAILNGLQTVVATEAGRIEAIAKLADNAATAKAGAADAKGGKDEAESGLWQEIRTLAESVDAATVDAENVKLTRAVFSAALDGICKNPEGQKSIAQYAATAGKVIEAVRAGKVAWSTLPEGVNAVRKAMKPDHKKALDAKKAELVKALGRVTKHKDHAKAMDALNALAEAIERFAIEADASREATKASNKAAKEIDGLRQQHPTTATEVETVAAAG